MRKNKKLEFSVGDIIKIIIDTVEPEYRYTITTTDIFRTIYELDKEYKSKLNDIAMLTGRISKAIDYINNHKVEWIYEKFEVDNVMVAFNEYANPQALLNILNGSDNNE